MKVFGCLCYPLTRPYNNSKLQFRSQAATFLGYNDAHKGYKALLPQGRLIISRDIIFDEASFHFHTLSLKGTSSPLDLHSTPSHIVTTHDPIVITHSPTVIPSHTEVSSPHSSADTHITSPNRHSIHDHLSSANQSPTDFDSAAVTPTSVHSSPLIASDTPPPSPPPVAPTHKMITRAKDGIFKPKVFTIILPDFIPKSALAALLFPHWKQAMLEEFITLLKNKTWILTTLPPDKNLIGSTWIFKIKRHVDGCIASYKARLVAQGFSQQPGSDFNDTFRPVVKPNTIRLIFSIAISAGWFINHLDVNNAFLHCDLEEDIYMKQPVGFEQGSPSFVCKLNKAIYGLKQASRAWFFTVYSVLISLGFAQSKSDASLFHMRTKNEVVYILIYVDDMLITGSNPTSIRAVIQQISKHFSLKDLGEVNLFLGIEVSKTKQGMHLGQAGYVKDFLKKAKMDDAKGCPTPMISSCELSKVVGDPTVDSKTYRSIVGGLQYATITRPDISYDVNKVSQYMAAPLDSHWKAVKRILRYLAGTLDFGIHIKRTDGNITGFFDSDWASDVDDRRSTTGYCTYYGSNLISWCAKKQSVVSRSSTEAEYRSLAHVASEITWMESLLSELKIKSKRLPVVWVDNLSAIALATNPVLHARTKHIEIDVHFVRDKVRRKELDIRHVPSADQIADIFTKPLSQQFFARLRDKLGVCSVTSLELREVVKIDNVHVPKDAAATERLKKDVACNATCIGLDPLNSVSEELMKKQMNWKRALVGHHNVAERVREDHLR